MTDTPKQPLPSEEVVATPDELRRFENFYIPEPMSGCWLWLGSCLKGKLYGNFWAGRRLWRAHRWAYAAFVGPIPDSHFVCHRCDNPACVNPAHLFVGTFQDNIDDKVKKGRQYRGERHFRTKLVSSQVLEIRESLETSTVLAARYGVSKTTIKSVKKRFVWGHVQ